MILVCMEMFEFMIWYSSCNYFRFRYNKFCAKKNETRLENLFLRAKLENKPTIISAIAEKMPQNKPNLHRRKKNRPSMDTTLKDLMFYRTRIQAYIQYERIQVFTDILCLSMNY